LGLELAPPILGGRVSAVADLWMQSVLRMGGAVALVMTHPVLVAARLDATTLTGSWGAGAAVRSEAIFHPGAATMSVNLEIGVIAHSPEGVGRVWPFAIVGLGFWSWRP
jgi:hypothetical protein